MTNDPAITAGERAARFLDGGGNSAAALDALAARGPVMVTVDIGTWSPLATNFAGLPERAA